MHWILPRSSKDNELYSVRFFPVHKYLTHFKIKFLVWMLKWIKLNKGHYPIWVPGTMQLIRKRNPRWHPLKWRVVTSTLTNGQFPNIQSQISVEWIGWENEVITELYKRKRATMHTGIRINISQFGFVLRVPNRKY